MDVGLERGQPALELVLGPLKFLGKRDLLGGVCKARGRWFGENTGLFCTQILQNNRWDLDTFANGVGGVGGLGAGRSS